MAQNTSSVDSKGMYNVIEELHRYSDDIKRVFARKWYENNFFDDGYHSRFVHRTTGRVVDVSDRGNYGIPKRVIPKASRQIRGLANLLLSFDYHPVIYPRRVDRSQFEPDIPDPETGQLVRNPYYIEAIKEAREEARKKGYFIEDVWDYLDMFERKLPLMMLLSMKNSASFQQFWYDAEKEKICSQVYDSFDIDVVGTYNDIELSPFIGKCIPKLLTEIQYDEKFDEEARMKVVSDNKLASSATKENYLQTLYGHLSSGTGAETALLYEYFIKERLNEDNLRRLMQQEDADLIGKGKKYGDTIIRQTFVAGGQGLLDRYIPGDKYPIVDFRMEPGPIWQTSIIERFIPANKSIDDVITRLERHINSNPFGMWLRHKDENFEISNSSTAYTIEYEGRPPQNVPTSPLPSDPFNLITLDERFIEEQGVTTTALGKLPPGVRANAAIETLKASEYANLTMNTKMLKLTVEKIAQRILFLADTYMVKMGTVRYMDGDETREFNVVGRQGYNIRTNQLQEEVPEDTVVISSEDTVKIEVETGPGYTVEGKRSNMLDLSRFFLEMAQAGVVNPAILKEVVQKLLETYQYGPTATMMEEFDKLIEGQGGGMIGGDMKEQMKMAVLEVVNDLQGGGSPTPPSPGQPTPPPQAVATAGG